MEDFRDFGKIQARRSGPDKIHFPCILDIEEKIDGSNASILIKGKDEFALCSRKRQLEENQSGWVKLWECARSLKNTEKYTGLRIYGEFLRGPRQNLIKYANAPDKNFIVFDILRDDEHLSRDQCGYICRDLGLTMVQLVANVEVRTMEELKGLSKGVKPMLGGEACEGIVAKLVTDRSKRIKVVREEFGETSRRPKNTSEPINDLMRSFSTPMRWAKQVTRMRDEGRLSSSTADIGPLIKGVLADIQEECIDDIKEKLWEAHKSKLMRAASSDIPHWYKGRLEAAAEGAS